MYLDVAPPSSHSPSLRCLQLARSPHSWRQARARAPATGGRLSFLPASLDVRLKLLVGRLTADGVAPETFTRKRTYQLHSLHTSTAHTATPSPTGLHTLYYSTGFVPVASPALPEDWELYFIVLRYATTSERSFGFLKPGKACVGGERGAHSELTA
eukprot:scaffold111244_cov35-Phaeocystis_antarctica.AAC.2